MLIGYKIEFKKDSLTITQQIDQRTVGSKVTLTDGSSLAATYEESRAQNANPPKPKVAAPEKAGTPFDDPGRTSGPFSAASGAAPITVIGPIFFGCRTSCCEDQEKEKD
jgi:hypothetical protein